MKNLLKKYDLNVVKYNQEGKQVGMDIIGLRELRDHGWLKVLPAKPRELFNLIRTFLGEGSETNKDEYGRIFAYPSYDYIMAMADFGKKIDITASIDFLALIGFITYKNATIHDQESNHYYFERIYSIEIVKQIDYAKSIKEIIKKTRTSNENEADKARFEKALKDMELFIDLVKKEEIFIELPLFHKNEKIRKMNIKTLQQIEKFFAAVYADIRYSVMDRSKHNYSSELYLYLSNLPNRQDFAESAEQCRIGTETPNRPKNADSCPYSPSNSPSIVQSKSPSNNNKQVEILDFLKSKLEYYVQDEQTLDLLLNQAMQVSVSQIQESIKIITMFIDKQLPTDIVRFGLLKSVLTKPDMSKALSMIEEFEASRKKGTRAGRQAEMRKAREVTPREYYEQMFKSLDTDNPFEEENSGLPF